MLWEWGAGGGWVVFARGEGGGGVCGKASASQDLVRKRFPVNIMCFINI